MNFAALYLLFRKRVIIREKERERERETVARERNFNISSVITYILRHVILTQKFINLLGNSHDNGLLIPILFLSALSMSRVVSRLSMHSITWITMFLFLDFVLTEDKKYSGIYQDLSF